VLNPNRHIRVLLPPEVTEVSSLEGKTYDWPVATVNGERIDLDTAGECGRGKGYKIFAPKLREDWCAALNVVTGEMIGYSFNASEIPFVGIWSNSGQWRGHYCMALEPTTSPTDYLDEAVAQFGEFFSLKPNESRKWRLNVIVGRITGKIEKITPQGKIIQE